MTFEPGGLAWTIPHATKGAGHGFKGKGTEMAE
jgi:hypothetical protein